MRSVSRRVCRGDLRALRAFWADNAIEIPVPVRGRVQAWNTSSPPIAKPMPLQRWFVGKGYFPWSSAPPASSNCSRSIPTPRPARRLLLGRGVKVGGGAVRIPLPGDGGRARRALCIVRGISSPHRATWTTAASSTTWIVRPGRTPTRSSAMIVAIADPRGSRRAPLERSGAGALRRSRSKTSNIVDRSAESSPIIGKAQLQLHAREDPSVDLAGGSCAIRICRITRRYAGDALGERVDPILPNGARAWPDPRFGAAGAPAGRRGRVARGGSPAVVMVTTLTT